MEYDFSGWATRNNIRCSDGRTIMKDAFKHDDGHTVPLVWNHKHDGPFDVLGHAVLENRDEGVYAYCKFNDTESGKHSKLLVEHGDVTSLSIYANQLKQRGNDVIHGQIREVSLVLAGANPGAFIDNVLIHGEETDDEAVIYNDGEISLYHADDTKEDEAEVADEKEKTNQNAKTVGDVIESMTEEQQQVMYALIGMALNEEPEDNKSNSKTNESEEGDDTVKHNVFDADRENDSNYLSHSDQQEIIALAKTTGIGSFQEAMAMYAQNGGNNYLKHAFDDDEIDVLFPEYKDVKPGAPELIERDQGWVTTVMNKVKKSPISRIRTRQADITGTDIRGLGYVKGSEKNVIGNIKLLNRTTDPQTVYVKDSLHRDDIVDITDFDVVNYIYGIMRQTLNEELALAILVGDGREDGDADKIYEDHIRSIWNDDDLYTIHYSVDIDSVSEELQGTNTSANFGENYIYAEAIVQAALYAREDYKGSGNPDFFCTPHLLNVMLLARDLNGRRIYDSKTDLEHALNVNAIYTAEQFDGLTREDDDGNTLSLLGIMVNLADYQIGSTKGGEITKFTDFDIDFNKEKYLIETRLSGALTRAYSAIALEEPVSTSESD